MMKKLMITTAAAMIAATMAQAQSGMADSILSQLQSQGYTRVEIKVGPTQIKAEAIKGNTKRELIYDRATGQLLKQESGTVSAGDDTTPGVEIDNENDDFLGGDDSSDDNGNDDGSDDDGNDDNSGSGSDDDSGDDDNSGSGSDDDSGDDNSGSDDDSGDDSSGSNDD